MRTLGLLNVAGAMLFVLSSVSMAAEDCAGTIQAEWLEDGRKMKLLADYTYVDPAGSPWRAPTAAEIDGASIPRFAWSIIGGPFEGKYRKASVVHDVACDTRTRSWRETHMMFYQAMLCSGVDATKAKIMYTAVYHCGPRWGDQGWRLFPCGSEQMTSYFTAMQSYVTTHPGASMEQLTPEDLQNVLSPNGPLDLREPVSDDRDFKVRSKSRGD